MLRSMIRRAGLGVVVSTIAASVFSIANADTEYQGDMPVPLVKALLGNMPYGEVSLFSDIDDDFPELTIPGSFSVLGSLNNGYAITLVLQTELARDGAINQLSGPLAQAEYSPYSTQIDAGPITGFVYANQPAALDISRFCHDSLGFITVGFQEHSDYNTVALASTGGGVEQNCAVLQEQQTQRMTSFLSGNGLREHLPKLVLPELPPRPFAAFANVGGYSGGSNRGIEIEASLKSDWDMDDVFSHFKDQIVEQGWIPDSENIGEASAIGTWTLSPEADLDLVGNLIVLKSGKESFELKFQLNPLGGAGSNSGFGVIRN